MSKAWVKLCDGFPTLYSGEGGIFKQTFQNSHNFLSVIVWNLTNTLKRWGSMNAVPNKLNLFEWVWLYHSTLYHECNQAVSESFIAWLLFLGCIIFY